MKNIADVLVSTQTMTRNDWLDWRRRGIGGSDAAAIAGLNPWKSPMAIWLDKTGQIEPEEAGEAAYWGNVLESVVADEFKERTGFYVQRRNAILQHTDYPWMLANVDRLFRDAEGNWGVLECKTTSEWGRKNWAEDEVPAYYLIQVQHYLAVTGYEYGYIAVLIGGNQYKHYKVVRDEEIIQYLIDIEKDFWQLVETNTPPAFDGSDSSSEVLKKLYPKATLGLEVMLPSTAQELIEMYEQASAEEKAAVTKKDEAGNKLKALLGDAEVGVLGDRKVSWKNINSTRFDSTKFKKDHQALYEEYSKESSYRRFDVR